MSTSQFGVTALFAGMTVLGLVLGTVFLAGCSSVKDVLTGQRGPFGEAATGAVNHACALGTGVSSLLMVAGAGGVFLALGSGRGRR